MRTKDVYPDGGYDDTFFTAFDPEVWLSLGTLA